MTTTSRSDRTRSDRLSVAIAHEWLVSYAGSERCVAELLEAFPDADLLTTMLVPDAVPPALRRARPSFLQHVPGAKEHHGWFLPAMPLAWRLRRPVTDVDLVISSSHACAKGVRVAPGIPHLCYCHTPMRYAWDFAAERERFPRVLRPPARAGMRWMRHWDRATAQRVTRFVANSTAVASRIAASYGRRASVVHPPVRTGFFTPGGEREDFFLFVGRLVAYKQPSIVVDAFATLPGHRLVVAGEGPLRPALEARATANVSFVGAVDDDELRSLYRTTRALVYPAVEDFGIVMAEAQACGAPVVGRATGGAVDIVEHGETGWLVDGTVEAVARAVRGAASASLDEHEIVRRAARFAPGRYRDEIREAALACLDEGRA